jgi:hypothetical protein
MSPAPAQEIISNAERLAADTVDDLQEINLQQIKHQVTATVNSQPPAQVPICSIYSNRLIGTEICDDFLRDLTLLEDTATSALDNEKGQAGALAGLSTLRTHYQEQLYTLQDVLTDFIHGRLPQNFNDLFQFNCTDLESACEWPSPLLPTAASKVHSLSSAGDDLTIDLLSPCLRAEDVVDQYTIKSLPYDESGHIKQVILPDKHQLWVRTYDNKSFIFVEEPHGCHSGEEGIAICPPQYLTEVHLIDQLQNIEENIYDTDNSVEVVDLSDNQVLIASPRKNIISYTCDGRTDTQEYSLHGITRAKLAPTCRLDIAKGMKKLQGSLYDMRRHGLQGAQEWLLITEQLLKKKQNKNLGMWSYLDPEHLGKHTNTVLYYLITAVTISLLGVLGVTLAYGAHTCQKGRKKRQVRRNRRKERPLMIVRNVPDL